jgi:hypothetical protein
MFEYWCLYVLFTAVIRKEGVLSDGGMIVVTDRDMDVEAVYLGFVS